MYCPPPEASVAFTIAILSLGGIADSLRHMRHEVKVAPAVAERARHAVTRMLSVRP